MRIFTLAAAAALLVACSGDKSDDSGSTATGETSGAGTPGGMATGTGTGTGMGSGTGTGTGTGMGDVVNPSMTSTVAVDGTVVYTATGLDDTQAHRVTLVVDANVTTGAGQTGTFIDGDMNGAADAGASEAIALITSVNGVAQAGVKTVPDGADDPASPSGVFPEMGTLTVTVTGVAAGTVYPVFYHNGGSSTFLEIDGTGSPTETYYVGGGFTVQ